MSLYSGWMDDARRSYCAYGADLIRTGCLLLRTTPSVTYRATVLFQRFQAVAEDIRRKRGDYQSMVPPPNGGDGPELAAATSATLYTLPANAGKERPSGILAMGDLYAPLDYCVFHLRKQDDIAYLTAACVLIAAKIEDPSTRIRLIVGVFMRLNQRRRGEPVIELLQPPQERYDDFKLCVLEAEELVLHALGFQTFVECPFKYAILFLGMLIQDEGENDDHIGSSTDDGTGGRSDAMCSINDAVVVRPPFTSDSFADVSVKKWLADAVCWLNDIPRSVDLYAEEAHVLALCALYATRPSNVVGFPDEWTLGFGIEKGKISSVLRVHQKQLKQALNSENSNIQLLIVMLQKKPNYPTAREEVIVSNDAAASAAPPEEITSLVPSSLPKSSLTESALYLSSSGVSLPVVTLPLVPPPPMKVHGGPLLNLQSAAIPEGCMGDNHGLHSFNGDSVIVNGAGSCNNINNNNIYRNDPGILCSNIDNSNNNSNSMPMEGVLPLAAERSIVDEFQFEDLKDLQRKRRQEEEAAEKKRTKRRRSSSRRKRRHSAERGRHHSSGRRREEGSRGKKRRRHTSPHRSHRSEHRQQHSRSGAQQSRSEYRDERSRHEGRQHNDTRHQRRRR